jgi:hypothetical protein
MSNDDDPYAPYPYPDYPHPSFRAGPDDGIGGDEGYTEFYPGVAFRPRAGGDHSFHELDKDREPHDPNVLEGMTPLDVLVSVFGATMTPYELEDILAQHAWNFDDTMQFLVERGPGNAGNGPTTGSTFAANNRGGPLDDRNTTFVGRQVPGRNMTPLGPNPPNRQMSRPGRVCRYFLAGECLRSDCRFRCVQ